MRVVALDLGSRRIGVAVSDATGTLASPYSTIERTTPERDHGAVATIVTELAAERVLVGLPKSMDGSERDAARAARAEAAAIGQAVSVPVELVDERLSTVAAHHALAATGMRERERRKVVDQVAAVTFLQAWLDGHH